MATDPPPIKPLETYSVFALLVTGRRFTDDFTEDDAVRRYVKLHPGSDPAAVRAELDAEIKRMEG